MQIQRHLGGRQRDLEMVEEAGEGGQWGVSGGGRQGGCAHLTTAPYVGMSRDRMQYEPRSYLFNSLRVCSSGRGRVWVLIQAM